MLWDVIIEFYIKYIFGGTWYDPGQGSVTYNPFVARVSGQSIGLFDFVVTIFGKSLPLGNYLSMVASLITMIVILILCCLLIKKIYNICAHIIG